MYLRVVVVEVKVGLKQVVAGGLVVIRPDEDVSSSDLCRSRLLRSSPVLLRRILKIINSVRSNYLEIISVLCQTTDFSVFFFYVWHQSIDVYFKIIPIKVVRGELNESFMIKLLLLEQSIFFQRNLLQKNLLWKVGRPDQMFRSDFLF